MKKAAPCRAAQPLEEIHGGIGSCKARRSKHEGRRKKAASRVDRTTAMQDLALHCRPLFAIERVVGGEAASLHVALHSFELPWSAFAYSTRKL